MSKNKMRILWEFIHLESFFFLFDFNFLGDTFIILFLCVDVHGIWNRHQLQCYLKLYFYLQFISFVLIWNHIYIDIYCLYINFNSCGMRIVKLLTIFYCIGWIKFKFGCEIYFLGFTMNSEELLLYVAYGLTISNNRINQSILLRIALAF